MELMDRVEQFNYDREHLVGELIDFFKDTSVPLEERWGLFEKSSNLLPEDFYTVYLPEIEKNDLNYYDDFYYDRYQTVDMLDLLEKIEDDSEKFSKINVEALKEQILTSGYGSFKFDW